MYQFVDTKEVYDDIKIPAAATKKSAGYDFYSPYDFVLGPGQSITIPTGIRCILDDGLFLAIVPRSGLGFKYRAHLANTVGVIDGDYSDSDNEGHIMIKLFNGSDAVMNIKKGQGITQGIALQYFPIKGGSQEAKTRNGGFGSTD